MAYAVKYQIQYKRRSNDTTTIHILKDGYVGDIIELTPDLLPLEIQTSGNVNNVFIPTIGSGAVIRVLATPLSLMELFTVNPQEFAVKCYHSTGTTDLFFSGYISTGIYSEDYSIGGTQKVPIEIQCTDGMALLDDYSYKPVESGTTLYSGSVSISQVLKNVLSKLNLTYSNLISSSDLQVVDGETNIFENLQVNQQNYLDEKQTPMSCREVLDTIFQPLGLTMSFRGDKIYIINPINLHDSALAKSYSYTGGTETTTTLGGYLDLSDTIGYYETGQQLDIVQPYNQINIKYDPYTYTGDEYDVNKVGNYSGGTFTCMTGATGDWQGNYWFASGITFTNNFLLGYGITGFGVKEITVNDDATPTYMLIRKLRGLQNGTYTYTFPFSSIKQDDGLFVKLSIDTYINTRSFYNILTPTVASTEFQALKVNNIVIKIGNKYWNMGTGKWQTTEHYSYNKMEIRQLDKKIEDSRISDTWVTGEMFIPLSELSASNVDLLSGEITIKIFTGVVVSDIITQYPLSYGDEDILNIFMKNIKVEIVDVGHVPIQNTGIETVVNLSTATTRKKTPFKIQLKNGCGVYGSSKGAYSSTLVGGGNNIVGMLRYIGTQSYILNTAKILGQDIISQYNTSRYKLTANLDVTQHKLNTDKYLIKDTNYLEDKAFFIASNTYYDAEENMSVEMIEITPNREIYV